VDSQRFVHHKRNAGGSRACEPKIVVFSTRETRAGVRWLCCQGAMHFAVGLSSGAGVSRRRAEEIAEKFRLIFRGACALQ
jgi:hypothetical protein